MTILSDADIFALGFSPGEIEDVKKLIDLKETVGELKTKDEAIKYLKSEKIVWW